MAANKKKYGLEHRFIALTIMLLICVVLGYTGRWWWFGDLLSHFALQYTVLALMFSLLLLWKRRSGWAIIALTICFAQGVKVYPYLASSPLVAEAAYEYEELNILQYNIFVHNKTKEKTVDWIMSQSDELDIIVLQEVRHNWLPHLKRLRDKYPFYKERPANFAWGWAIYSKLDNNKLDIFQTYDRMEIQKLVGRKNNIPITIYSAHPPPPVIDFRWQERNDLLARLAKIINYDKSKNIIATGDFNITPYSFWYQKLLDDSGLRNSSDGRGINATWPNFIPSFMRIPIDHTLISKNIIVNDKIVGEYNGSDHLPVITKLRIVK